MTDGQHAINNSLTPTAGPPPAAPDPTDRVGVARDLYALFNFYVSNPGHPLPSHITINHSATAEDLRAIAAQHGADVWGVIEGLSIQTEYKVRGTSVPVTMIITAAVL